MCSNKCTHLDSIDGTIEDTYLCSIVITNLCTYETAVFDTIWSAK